MTDNILVFPLGRVMKDRDKNSFSRIQWNLLFFLEEQQKLSQSRGFGGGGGAQKLSPNVEKWSLSKNGWNL